MADDNKVTLLHAEDWQTVEGEMCRVIDFVPMAAVIDGKVKDMGKTLPYGSILLECVKFPHAEIRGFITHRVDFLNLWAAFRDRGVGPDEEVIVSWYSRPYKRGLIKLFAAAMPKLIVMICPKKAYELINDETYRPELQGAARFYAERPIVQWKPEIMDR